MTHNDTGNVDASLDDVLITQELARRPARAPDYHAQSRALTLLSRELVTNPRGVPQRRRWRERSGRCAAETAT